MMGLRRAEHQLVAMTLSSVVYIYCMLYVFVQLFSV